METLSSKLVWGFAAGLVAFSAHAYDPTMAPQDAMDAVRKLDCQSDVLECRYYAAVEAAAYFDACPAAMKRKLGATTSPDQMKQIQDILSEWTALEPSELKAAVLSPDNKLRHFLAGKAIDYLVRGTSTDLGIECTRVGLAKNGEQPEDMSELLRVTRNFAEWDKIRHRAKQSAFMAAQELLRQESSTK